MSDKLTEKKLFGTRIEVALISHTVNGFQNRQTEKGGVKNGEKYTRY